MDVAVTLNDAPETLTVNFEDAAYTATDGRRDLCRLLRRARQRDLQQRGHGATFSFTAVTAWMMTATVSVGRCHGGHGDDEPRAW